MVGRSTLVSMAAAVLCSCAVAIPQAMSSTYYVSTLGSDQNDGKSPQTSWRSLAKAGSAAIAPGDTVLLRRGDVWRESLSPKSGKPDAFVTYGAYGSGAKPLLLGSVRRNNASDWKAEGNNIWMSVESSVRRGAELLVNPSFSKDDAYWGLYWEHGAVAQGARDTSDCDSAPASYRILCKKTGKTGSDIQFYTGPIKTVTGRRYQLSFRAKCSRQFELKGPGFFKNGPPWDSYGQGPWPRHVRVGTSWASYTFSYIANTTAEDARLDFLLGVDLPEGATLHIDSLSFTPCEGDNPLTCDVGNIIFNGGAVCGVKMWKESDLNAQGKYWYDEDRNVVKVYSTRNPAEHYSDIECALTAHIINQSNRSYVIYENLALMYGAAHGVGGANTHHIIVRDCDFGFIGGGDQCGGDRTIRYGNGIEFWAGGHDCLVERCRLWEVYDAALTNQSGGPRTRQYNITYRHNLIWNCEYSFEYWNRPGDSETFNIRFENNTCLNAGHGWGHTQRPDPSGRHLCFYGSTAPARDIIIRNNIFYEAKGNAFYAPSYDRARLDGLIMNNNCWYQSKGIMVHLKGRDYTMEQFSAYQAEQKMEDRSIVAKPLLTAPDREDFHLTGSSPCIDAGVDVGIRRDYEGTPVPQGKAPDIGAYEFK